MWSLKNELPLKLSMEVLIHPGMAAGYYGKCVRDTKGCLGPWEQKNLVSNRDNKNGHHHAAEVYHNLKEGRNCDNLGG